MSSEEEATNEYLDLPDDPEVAFAVLHRKKYKILEEYWEDNTRRGGGWFHERQYVDTLVAFDEVHNLGIMTAYRNPPTIENDFGEFFQDARRHAEITSQKILMEAARRQKIVPQNMVILDSSARQAIHMLINALREKLNALSLAEDKRDSLFNKLNAFAAEVDRNRTRTEAFYAFAVETARTAGQVGQELKPLQETIDRVLDWIEKAQKWKDALPGWGERKKIGGPPKAITNSQRNLDDDIPF